MGDQLIVQIIVQLDGAQSIGNGYGPFVQIYNNNVSLVIRKRLIDAAQ